MTGPVNISAQLGQQASPLKLTTARWFNRKTPAKDVAGQPTERWSKVLAHKGPLTQFAYGTDTPSDWNHRLQWCVISAPHTGTITIDVDSAAGFARTRLSQLVSRADAWSERDADHFHVLVDARGVPPDQWPGQGGIFGGDIKSNGWIPVPGSEHYSGQLYRRLFLPDGTVRVMPATPELIAAMAADRADFDTGAGPARAAMNGSGGTGGGHDGQIAAAVLGWVRQAMNAGQDDPENQVIRDWVYDCWLQVAIPLDPSWDYTRDDFERHYRTAVAKARATDVTASAEEMAWAQRSAAAAAAPDQAREQARRARDELREHNASWLVEPDDDQLDFVLCVAVTAGSPDDGEKLWGIVVGGSSSAKSEDIKMVFGLADAKLSDLTAAGLLSWTEGIKSQKVTGLLTRIPSPAFVVIEDLAPVLADTADRQNRSKLISILRRVYDGEVQRDLGRMSAQAVWSGKVTMLAASTKVIDQQSALMDEAGPRWLLYRGTESAARTRLDGTGKVVSAADKSAARVRSRELAALAVISARAALAGMELTADSARAIGDIAVATGTLRGTVPREGYGRREISGIASTEEPWRLEQQLQILARAALALGRSQEEAVSLARRVALGTVPPERMRAVRYLAANPPATANAVGKSCGFHNQVAQRALEDLRELKVTEEDATVQYEGYGHWKIGATDIGKCCKEVALKDAAARQERSQS